MDMLKVFLTFKYIPSARYFNFNRFVAWRWELVFITIERFLKACNDKIRRYNFMHLKGEVVSDNDVVVIVAGGIAIDTIIVVMIIIIVVAVDVVVSAA